MTGEDTDTRIRKYPDDFSDRRSALVNADLLRIFPNPTFHANVV